MQRSVLVACQRQGSTAFDLVDHLLRDGCKVIILGDFLIDTNRNLKQLKNLSNLQINSHNTLHPMSDMSNVDQIYHLACPTIEQYEDDPVQALESCFIGTKNLLDVALRCNARVVLGSNSTSTPVRIAPYQTSLEPSTPRSQHGAWDDRLRQRKRKRSSEPALPVTKRRRMSKVSVQPFARSYYDEGNRLAEMLCSAYEEHFGLDVRIAPISETKARVRTSQGLSTSRDAHNRTLTIDLPTDDTLTGTTNGALIESHTISPDYFRTLVDSMEAPAPGRPASGLSISE